MDQFKVQSLIAQGQVVTAADVNPDKAYLQVGVFQEGNRQIGPGNANAYAPYAISLSEVLSNKDACVGFKPGSVGPKVSFIKPKGSTVKDVIIPGKLELTRGNNGGLYNIAVENYYSNGVSPQDTYWSSQFLNPGDTSWAVVGDIANRLYNTWNIASGGNPPQYVGMPVVMKYLDPSTSETRYWLIMFTEWGVGGYGEIGEFAYDRYEIYPAVAITQPDACNSSTPLILDKISDGVHLTRQYQGGPIFNIVDEPLLTSNFWYRAGVSPRNTKWNSSYTDSRPGYSGFADLSNLENRVYSSFASALDGNVGYNAVGTELIMHDLTTDLYWKFEFSSWTNGCGGGTPLGAVLNFEVTDFGGGTIPDGLYNDILGTGGTGTGYTANISIKSGSVDILFTSTNTYGENYTVGDVLTFILPTGSPVQFTVTNVCCQGGFAYTRQVVPQSCPIKFADGSVMTTASSGGGSSIPTLQQVLDFNHDLVNGNNFQGSSAGSGTGGSTLNCIFIGEAAGANSVNGNMVAIGTNAALNQIGSGYSVFLGDNSGISNQGGEVNAIGYLSAFNNQGTNVIALGTQSLRNNLSSNVIGIGTNAGYTNKGASNISIGSSAGFFNEGAQTIFIGEQAGDNSLGQASTGSEAIGIGHGALVGNQGNYVVALGTYAGANNTIGNSFIIHNNNLPTFPDHASAVIGLGGGSPNNTYLYLNTTTNAISGVRL